ncbi:KinB-signaling pathway activation protein [Staphylospora marina]|uniref:KinB-signaling pathway activation protein n=1 Tax=Staphylospora marina TaxID=2490858 RepID=UPI0013DDEBFF|nr:KinB-signaling pathway activation protein [Staphylospora marina]
MTLKNLFHWFWSTLALGSVSALVLAFLIEAVTGGNVFGEIGQLLLLALTLSAAAELGFFSYLVFNWLSRGLIRNKGVYDAILFFLTALVIGNLVYLNAVKFSGTDFWIHLSIPAVVLIAALITAWAKTRMTNGSAWWPTFFFMTAATILECIPSINAKAGEVPVPILLHTVLVVLICNAWQILRLHRWVSPKKEKTRG